SDPLGHAALERAPDGRVDRLRAARGEDHLAGPRAEERGDLLARGLDRDAGPATFGVQPPRVAVVLTEERHNRRELVRAEGQGRGVVEISPRRHPCITGHCAPPSRSPSTAPLRSVLRVTALHRPALRARLRFVPYRIRQTRATQWSSPSGRLS